MGLFFSLLYIVTGYLTPTALFGDLSELRLELIFGILAIVATIFQSRGSGALRWIQTWALLGLGISAGLSILLKGWLGGSISTLIDFGPPLVSFLMVGINFQTKRRILILTGVLFLSATFIIAQGMNALRTPEVPSTYIYSQKYETAEDTDRQTVYRVRGAGVFNDPNDFAQLLVALLPCVFFFRKKGDALRNVMLVYVPAGILLYGMYLSHSRGCMVALMVMAAVAGRRKIGLLPAGILGAVLFVGMTAAGFSGGREVSAGEDRIGAWSTGIGLIRAHPMFGVGMGLFTDYNDITAHNSIVVTAAEIGLVGYFFWIMLISVSVRNAYVSEGEPENLKMEEMAGGPRRFGAMPVEDFALTSMRGSAAAPAKDLSFLSMEMAGPRMSFPQASGYGSPVDIHGQEAEQTGLTREESQRMSRLMLISLVGMMTAGWFLSRSFSILIYVQTGMAAAIYQMSRNAGFAPAPLPVKTAAKVSATVGLSLLIVVYVIVRVDHFMPH